MIHQMPKQKNPLFVDISCQILILIDIASNVEKLAKVTTFVRLRKIVYCVWHSLKIKNEN